MRNYSPFFSTIYDEVGPVGTFGRGTHYSVLRATSWHEPHGGVSKRPLFFDFAVIWDEDHDTRVIAVIEEIYLAGLLSKFMFFGERKGILTALLHDDVAISTGSPMLHKELRKANENTTIGDYWTVEICRSSDEHSIIASTSKNISVYLATIKMLWQLGGKAIEPRGDNRPTFEQTPLP